jgi:hypothetical protein
MRRRPGDLITVTNRIMNLVAAQAGQSYAVEFRPSLFPSDHWNTLTNFAAQSESTNLLVSDPVTDAQRFYRLRLP